jgi:hypothetical protein
MATNASKVAQIRGNEGLSKKKIENLQEELKRWTTHKVYPYQECTSRNADRLMLSSLLIYQQH